MTSPPRRRVCQCKNDPEPCNLCMIDHLLTLLEEARNRVAQAMSGWARRGLSVDDEVDLIARIDAVLKKDTENSNEQG